MKEIKALPKYLQPKILSAVAYVNSASPDLDKAMSLLTFEKLLDIVKDSKEFENYTHTMKARTIN
jgi:hypothetical protein